MNWGRGYGKYGAQGVRGHLKRKKDGTFSRSGGFPSKLEAAVFDHLKIRELAGEISELTRQATVVLQDGPPNIRIAWKVDFRFIETDTGDVAYAEAKGIETEDYKLKLKLWRFKRPAKLYIFKGNYTAPRVTEVIKAAL